MPRRPLGGASPRRLEVCATFLTVLCGLWLAVSCWAAEETLDEAGLRAVLRGSAGPAGFCAQLGWGDGRWALELGRGGRCAVHVLEAMEPSVQAARAQMAAQGLTGQVVIESWNATVLPYADNLINVLIVENTGRISERELLRVVTPGGLLCTKQGNRWQVMHKPWPADLDEWTHWRHGADGNMVSHDRAVTAPTGIRWVAGPVQDAGGRKWYYDHVLVSAAGRSFYLYESNVVARDSFNGRLLWDRAGKATIYKESGTFSILKLGIRTSKVRPVATATRLYSVLDGKFQALDTTTGETVQTLCDAPGAREVALLDQTLLLSGSNCLRAFNLDTSLRWEKAESPRRFVAGNGRIFLVAHSNVVCLQLADGAERWRVEEAKAPETTTCTYYNGVLVLERSSWRDDGEGSGIIAFSGETGQRLWATNYTPGLTHYKEARSFFADGLVWLEMETQQKPHKVGWVGFDPLTGGVRKQWGARGLHCSTPIATDRCLITPEMQFTDLATGEQTQARMAKSACRLPFTPANGLLYTFPVQCECFPMLRGYMGLARSTADLKINSAPRLQRGPAWKRLETSVEPVAADEWPIYRHDSWRSDSTPNALPEGELKLLWQAQVAAPATGLLATDWAEDPFARGWVTPAVCASGIVLAALPHRHQIVALDPKTGARRWQFTAGGRVDTAPSICGQLAVFGAHDGYVYAVALTDGQLAWRFRAAPFEGRIAVYGQIESPWPVAGSVLTEDGMAYCAAGRHPACDGGLRVVALRVRDGKLMWEQPISDMGVKNWYSAMLPNSTQKVGVDYEPVDLLARDGDTLAMSRWRFNPQTGKVLLAFTSTNYQAFEGLQVPRGLWGYGIRQTKMVLDRPAAAFNAQKLVLGATNDVAVLLAGTNLVNATAKGELKFGRQVLRLGAPAVHDGLIAAQGRLYISTRDGRIQCVGRE